MKKIIVICGPTASGKTKMAIEVAKYFNLEIINGDSVQALKELQIGSAKISEEEKEGIKHYLLDVLEPSEKYSSFDFQTAVRNIIDNSGATKIICGGTGLYIKAGICDYEFVESKRADDFFLKYEKYSDRELYEILCTVDNEAAKILHPNNRRRVLRAIEISEQSNTLKSKQNKKDTYLYDSLIIFLNPNREELYDKINLRVDLMMKSNLEKEVRDLYDRNILIDAIGYKEFYPYFKGEINLEDVIKNIKTNTRHFAKRQITFFKNQFTATLIDIEYNFFYKSVEEVIKKIELFLKG